MKRVLENTASILIGAKLIGHSNLGFWETIGMAVIYIIVSLFVNEERD